VPGDGAPRLICHPGVRHKLTALVRSDYSSRVPAVRSFARREGPLTTGSIPKRKGRTDEQAEPDLDFGMES
jgi:hypothetical protein